MKQCEWPRTFVKNVFITLWNLKQIIARLKVRFIWYASNLLYFQYIYILTLRIVERTKFTMTAERRSRDSRRHPTTTAMDCIRGKLLFFLLLFFIITDSKSSSALLLLSVYIVSSGEEKSAFLFKHFGDDIICISLLCDNRSTSQADVRG